MEFRKLLGRFAPPRLLESDVETRFTNVVLGMGGWPIKMRLLGFAGFPDRMVLWKGGVVHFIELKRPKKGPRALQLQVHRRLARYGFWVYVIRDYGDVDEYMEAVEVRGKK